MQIKKTHGLQTCKASRNNSFLVQPIEHNARKLRERWKAALVWGVLPGCPLQTRKTNTGLQHNAPFTVREAVLQVDLSRCMFLTYLLLLLSWETHEQGCAGRAASCQQELSSVIPPAEPLQIQPPRVPSPSLRTDALLSHSLPLPHLGAVIRFLLHFF